MRINRYKKGFGLLEVAISGTIITIIMSSLVVLGRSSLVSAETATERSSATYLAQEGIEKVRQMRDTNWIDNDSSTAWNSLCWYDAASPPVKQCPSFDADPNNKYKITYIPGFKRSFLEQGTSPTESHQGIDYTVTVRLYTPGSHIKSILPANESTYSGSDVDRQNNGIIVEVAVTWPGRTSATTQNVTVRELLTNWRPNY